jgi:hypothetical protein
MAQGDAVGQNAAHSPTLLTNTSLCSSSAVFVKRQLVLHYSPKHCTAQYWFCDGRRCELQFCARLRVCTTMHRCVLLCILRGSLDVVGLAPPKQSAQHFQHSTVQHSTVLACPKVSVARGAVTVQYCTVHIGLRCCVLLLRALVCALPLCVSRGCLRFGGVLRLCASRAPVCDHALRFAGASTSSRCLRFMNRGLY